MDICRDAGISYDIYSLRRKSGMTHEEALSTPRYGSYKNVSVYGKSLMVLCKESGISYSTYRYRRARGMTHEEALSTPAQKK